MLAEQYREARGKTLLEQRVVAVAHAFQENILLRQDDWKLDDGDRVASLVTFTKDGDTPGWFGILMFKDSRDSLIDAEPHVTDILAWSEAAFGPYHELSQFFMSSCVVVVYVMVDVATMKPTYQKRSGWLSWGEFSCL